ncbi:MAG: SDR family oxidoreductase [Thermodesulfobacteriota bacterium]
MAKVLVTGGAGFIGSNLTETLLKLGHEVRVLDNFSTGKRENLIFDDVYPFLEIVEGDICNLSDCKRAVRGIEYLFHQAALPSVQRSVDDPLTTHSVNAAGTLNLLIASRDEGVRRFIYASSSSIYGDTPSLPKKESMPPTPLSPYALQKYIGEEFCRLFYQLYGFETISLRYFNIFGPKQDPQSIYSAVIPKFIHALLHEESPVIYGDGEQSRDFTYIENVVHANLLAMDMEHASGEVVNIGCGKQTSLNQLLSLLTDIMGINIPPRHEEPRKGDVRHSLADITRAKEILNYEPQVGIEEGLRRTVKHYRKEMEKR